MKYRLCWKIILEGAGEGHGEPLSERDARAWLEHLKSENGKDGILYDYWIEELA